MNANELRIGNLTYRIDVAKQTKVIDKLTIYDIARIVDQSFNVFDYEEIVLTKEILLKLGYKEHNFGFYNKGHNLWVFNELFICNMNGVILKYVHEIQNLYFALTKKELNYE
jgi:hypothetical protein